MSDRFHVLYDGRCSFCGKVVDLLIKANRPGKLEAVRSQDRARIASDFPAINPADLEKAMYVVGPKGGIFRGFFAFRRLMSTTPWFWPLLPVFYFPGAGWIGPVIYAWVARNRSRMGCEGDACVLPPPERPR
jgi:predicted DCC family thiol-disulfide oxidoreductase YuxK